MHRCALHSALIAKGKGMMHARASKRDAHRPKPNPVDVVEASGMRETLLAAALAAIAGAAGAHAAGLPESYYQEKLCAGMELEVELANGARVDCVSETHAIEVDFTEDWAEALGQALLYAAATGKRPGIILVCRLAERHCLQHALRLEEAITFWRLPVDVWRHQAETGG